MSAIDPQKKAIVQELLSRRSSLSPEKAAIVDELASRFGLGSGADFSDVQGGSSTTKQAPPALGEAMKGVVLNNPQLNMLIGAGKGLGEFVQSGGQWLENLTGQPVSPPRTTTTGRDVFAPTNTNQSVGKVGGQIGIGAALAGAAPAGLAGQVGAGGLIGGLMAPDNPAIGATVGMAGPIAAKGVEKTIPFVRALMQGTEGLDQNFNQIMAAAKDVPHSTDATWDIGKVVLDADQLGKAGATVPKIFKDYQRLQGPLNYETGRDFAKIAGRLSATENPNPIMQRQVALLAKALGNANREAAVRAGVGELYDATMKQYAVAKGALDMKDALIKVLKDHGVKAALTGAGVGAGYGIYKALAD